MRPLILFHGGCNDGFCAAWIYRRCVTSQAEFRPIQYNELPPDVQGRDTVILDFSYPRSVLEQMVTEATSLLVIDHHATAERELSDLPYCVFAADKSAARLTWEHFFDPQQQTRVNVAPWLVDYTEDRDLWHWALPNSRAINAALSSYPRRFDIWDHISQRGVGELTLEGRAILRYQRRLVQPRIRHHGWTHIAGYRVPVSNATYLSSEIGNALAEDQPFAAVFFVTSDNRVVYNLRSRSVDGIDVGEIAKRYGGGGHRHAAAFTVDSILPMEPRDAHPGSNSPVGG